MASVNLQEKANFTRLSRLLVDKGTDALRNRFDTIHPPASLLRVLHANRTSLLRLRPRIINHKQWDLLYPPGNPPDSQTFDVTLLTVLLRNICGLHPPATGWDGMPPDTNRSVEANIARIKSLRNEVYAHATSTKVDNATFESLWQKIAQALIELNIPQNDVDDLRTSPLGHEEEIFLHILKDWKTQDEECKNLLDQIKCSVNCVEVRQGETKKGQEENKKRQEEIKKGHEEIREGQGEIKQGQEEIKQSLHKEIKQGQEEILQGHEEIKHLIQSSALKQENDKEPPQSSITRSSQVKDTKRDENSRKGSDEDILRKLAKHNFKSKIKGKVKFFHPGTREWLLKKLDDWFENEVNDSENESSIFLLTAGPGFGKSVFAAKVCEDFKKNGKFAACHFCEFNDSNLRDPMAMLQSLASQMCENIVGFREKLLDQLKRPHRVESLKDAFGIYLQNPLDELEVEEPNLIVIDGLDESAADDKNEIMNLIAFHFPHLPKCIKIFVTSRSESSVTKLSDLPKLHIGNNDVLNDLDLEIYLTVHLPCLTDQNEEMYDVNHSSGSNDLNYSRASLPVIKNLVRKCEGSFLYAFYVQSELKKRDDLEKVTHSEITELFPAGLNSIYQAYFKRFEDELKAILHVNVDVLNILELLAASEGPLPLKFITQTLGLAPDCRETKNIISKVNETVSCLLYVSNDLVTVFHKSVIDWLLANGYEDHEYAVKIGDGNKSLWLMCEQVFKEIRETVSFGHDLNLTNDVKYALEHGHRYLIECNMKESFCWLVDVVIIHLHLSICLDIISVWQDILKNDAFINDELRKRVSWHLIEITFLVNKDIGRRLAIAYLESVLTHSPIGYFNDDEKRIAMSLLSKFTRFIEFYFYDMEVIPLAVNTYATRLKIKEVGISLNKLMAAVACTNGGIFVICLPALLELYEYSTGYEGISCCTFAPDDSFVLFGKLETVLNVAERKEVSFFPGNKETFVSCAFSPNGKRLVTSNGSRTVKMWDVTKQSLLSLFTAEVPVSWCSFSSTGFFIIGERKYDKKSATEDWYCVWNAITWQRSDERNLPEVKLKEQGILRSKKCNRCLRPGSLRSGNKLDKSRTSEGIYNGMECIFSLEGAALRVVENTHFTTLAVWGFSFSFPWLSMFQKNPFCKITAIEDCLWFCADTSQLFVFKTLSPIEQQHCLPCPTCVVWSSFSPDDSRLATCTSDGYINVWNVDTSQVDQRFKSNHEHSSFACWWSKKFLFVFDIFYEIPRLSKYPVDVSHKVLFSQGQQVSLCHLVDDFALVSAIADFSEGFLSLQCGETKPVIVLDVNEVGEPRMVTLPGIKPMMSITVSPGGSFIFGSGNDCARYMWKRNTDNSAVYEVFLTNMFILGDFFTFSFSDDSKVAVVLGDDVSGYRFREIIDLNTGNKERVYFAQVHDRFLQSHPKLFCINEDRVVIVASGHFIRFFDMNSGALLASSFQRYLTEDLLVHTKLSPKTTILAFPKVNGDMIFLRLCIPPDLSNIKREAAIDWAKEFGKRF